MAQADLAGPGLTHVPLFEAQDFGSARFIEFDDSAQIGLLQANKKAPVGPGLARTAYSIWRLMSAAMDFQVAMSFTMILLNSSAVFLGGGSKFMVSIRLPMSGD